MITNRINLRQKAIRKFESLIMPNYKLLKTNTIFFDKELIEVKYATCKDGYNIFVRKDDSRVLPMAVNGKDLMDIINCLNQNQFFSYVYTGEQRCKVKPKKLNA